MALRVEDTDSPDRWSVSGRGELHLGILIETMRREGYEFQVSQPQVIFRTIDGTPSEPYETLVLDVPEVSVGSCIEKLGMRKAEMQNMETTNDGRTQLEFVVPAAHAQADLNVSTPAVRTLTGRMESRHAQLSKYYDSGAVGLTSEGLVELRDANAVALAERNQVKKLVADENSDRDALYREIASANGHPEWEADIRSTFAARWVANARSGWWYRSAAGQWSQK